MSKVNVYDEEKVIARVNYNNNLDYWDGSNWSCGSVGRHRGLTRLKDGRYVLIHGSQWQGERDWAEIISKDEALQEIIRSDKLNLLKKYPDLQELYDAMELEEES